MCHVLWLFQSLSLFLYGGQDWSLTQSILFVYVKRGERSDNGVFKEGFVYDSFGLQWRLLAFRLSFSKFSQ